MKKNLFWNRQRCLLTIAVSLFLALLSRPTAESADPIEKGLRIFSAGHSFHFFVPPILKNMAESAGITGHVQIGLQALGGSRVIQHWKVDDARNTVKKALRTGAVDVLTLSPIYLPDEGIKNFADLALQHNPNIRITIQENWLPFDNYDDGRFPPRNHRDKVDNNAKTADELKRMHAPYFKSIDEHVQELNQHYGKQVLFVVPVGQAVIALREKIINGEAPGLKEQKDLFGDPIGHATPPLQVLVAYCHYATTYRRSPIGLPTSPLLAKVPDADKLNRLLQELAWDAVRQHPLSGVSSNSQKNSG